MINSLFLEIDEYVGPEYLDLKKLESQIQLATEYQKKELKDKILKEAIGYFSRLHQENDHSIKKVIQDKNSFASLHRELLSNLL